MNIVYWFSFMNRIENKTPPYYYIGSKTNCSLKNGRIIDSKGNEYWSSCKQKLFKDALDFEKPLIKIIDISDNPLIEEEYYHKFYDVSKSRLFFNKATASGKFGGSGDKAPRYGIKASDECKRKMSKTRTGRKYSLEHKNKISLGMKSFYKTDEMTYNNDKLVHKTLSESAKKRHLTNPHPKGMLGKKMPRKECPICFKMIGAPGFKNHIKNCK